MIPDLFWIPGTWQGKLAIAARPRGGEWLEDETSGLERAGVDILVSLLENDEERQLELEHEAAIMKANGLHFISFPIPDRGVPVSKSGAMALIDAISDALNVGQNVAIHCRQGIGRSGLIAAAVLAASGLDHDKAIDAVSSARGLRIPETPDQRLWIRQLPARRPAFTR